MANTPCQKLYGGGGGGLFSEGTLICVTVRGTNLLIYLKEAWKSVAVA